MKIPPETIDVTSEKAPADDRPPTTQALVRAEPSGAVARALSISELQANLDYIRDVMRTAMKEGEDYGKIPGCGDKPALLQPGAQKLCMTFQLDVHVKEQKIVDLPGFHREVRMVVSVRSQTGREWDGVGICSTLESKYRYRKAERRCPECGETKIIVGKAEYGGGFVCFKKKGGCGAKFAENDARITSQAADTVEYENPPDYWNTVEKMAFKRAHVHASINATNTSMLWTQDLDEMKGNEDALPPQKPMPPVPGNRRPAPAKAAPPAPAKTPDKPKIATAATRIWMMKHLQECEKLATEYFRALAVPAVLMPTEELKDIPLAFVPVSGDQMRALKEKIAAFGNGEEADHAFPPNQSPRERQQEKSAATNPPPAAKPPPAPSVQASKAKDPEWFWGMFISVPRRGMKKAEYDKNPDTILELYKGGEEEHRRLFGLANNWQPEPRTVGDRTYQPSDADFATREGLDAFLDWEEKHHADTHGNPKSPEPEPEAEQDTAIPF